MHSGIVTLVFDDGYQSVYKNVVPLLREFNIPGVFALVINHKNCHEHRSHPIRPWPEWLSLRQQGHEIASHTLTHRNLTTLSAAQLEEELRSSQQTLNASTLIYPGGAFNDQIAQLASKHYRAARTTRKGFEKIPTQNAYQLRTFNFTRENFSLAKVNALVIWAWLTNSWLIETYHLVDDLKHQTKHAVSIKKFRQHLSFLKRVPVKVKTIEQTIT